MKTFYAILASVVVGCGFPLATAAVQIAGNPGYQAAATVVYGLVFAASLPLARGLYLVFRQ